MLIIIEAREIALNAVDLWCHDYTESPLRLLPESL